MSLTRLAAVCLALLLGACATAPQAPPRRALVMISIDGFRADYIERGLTPTLARMAEEGVHAERMRPSFPAMTYPNHYTLVTGLRPDHHGLVHNSMEDPRRPGVPFTLSDRRQVMDPFWWDEGEPIWVTAQKAGLKTVNVFWPGSEAPIHGVYPDRWKVFDQSVSANDRVDLALSQIKTDHPAFTAIYFDDVDTNGHRFGPDSEENKQALGRVDAAIARLLAGLEAQGLGGKVDVIVASDHGMVLAPNRIFLEDVAKGAARVISAGSTSMLEPLPGREKEAEALFVGRHDHMTCWNKAHVPPRFHYGSNPRVASIVCLGDVGWYLTTRDAKPSPAQHGFDPNLPEMGALFVAWGPSFKRGESIEIMDNVDIYPLAMRLLGVPARPNDGDPDFPAKALR